MYCHEDFCDEELQVQAQYWDVFWGLGCHTVFSYWSHPFCWPPVISFLRPERNTVLNWSYGLVSEPPILIIDSLGEIWKLFRHFRQDLHLVKSVFPFGSSLRHVHVHAIFFLDQILEFKTTLEILKIILDSGICLYFRLFCCVTWGFTAAFGGKIF